MKYTRLSALALAGALTLSLAACSNKAPTPSPDVTDPAVESVAPSVQPSQAPEQGGQSDGKVTAAWEAIAGSLELPKLMELDDDLLSSLYYLDASLLEEYVAKMPVMNVHATEFFIAKVKPGNMDAVKAAISKRQADMVSQWSMYLPEQLELVENYQLMEDGDYVMFCVCEDTGAAVAAFEGAIGGSAAALAPAGETTPAPAASKAPQSAETPAPVVEQPPAAQADAQGVYTAVAQAGEISGFVDTSFALDAYYDLAEEDLADYALYMPDMSTDLQEVFVARAAQGKLETVKAACQSRQQGLKEDAAFYTGTGSYIDSYQLATQGDWVLFYVGPNAEAAVSAFTSAAQ